MVSCATPSSPFTNNTHLDRSTSIQQRKTTCLLSIRRSLACELINNVIGLGLGQTLHWRWCGVNYALTNSSCIIINNNKHVYRQSQVRMPNGSGVEWAECSLIIGTGCRVQVFSLILDSSVGLSAGIQSAGDSVPETLWVRILHSAEEDNLSAFDSKIACLCHSIEINNNKHSLYIAGCTTAMTEISIHKMPHVRNSNLKLRHIWCDFLSTISQ